MVEAATWAPSSTNSQPWRFILVTQRELISQMAQMVRDECQRLSEQCRLMQQQDLARFFRFLRHYAGFFGDASAVFLACAEKYDLNRFGLDERTVLAKAEELGAPNFASMLWRTVEKSVAMSVQNLLLKAHELGYGTCVMDAPLIVERDLRHLLGIPPEHQLVMVIPVGVPAADPRQPGRKSVDQVVRYVEMVER
jgi:nitroreductase